MMAELSAVSMAPSLVFLMVLLTEDLTAVQMANAMVVVWVSSLVSARDGTMV